MKDLIKMLYISNRLNMTYINEERKRKDDVYLLSLYEKLEDCQSQIIDLADREGVDLYAI